MHESEKWKWSRSVVSDPQQPHGLQPSRLLHPWDFPGKSTGVGCHWVCCYLHAIINMLWYKHIIQPQFYDKKATAHNFSVRKKFTLRVQVFKFKLNLSDRIRSKNNGWGINRNSGLWCFIYNHFFKPSLCASWGFGLPLPQGLRTYNTAPSPLAVLTLQ